MMARAVVTVAFAISSLPIGGIQFGKSKGKDPSSEKALPLDLNVVSSIREDLKSVESTVTGIEGGLKALGSGIHGLDEKVDKVENRISGLDSDMDTIEKKLDEVLQRFITMEAVPKGVEFPNVVSNPPLRSMDSGIMFPPPPLPAMTPVIPRIPPGMIPPPPPLPSSFTASSHASSGGPPPPPPPPPVGIFTNENKPLWGEKRVQTTTAPTEAILNVPGVADMSSLAAEKARKMSADREKSMSIEEKIAASKLERQSPQQSFRESLRKRAA